MCMSLSQRPTKITRQMIMFSLKKNTKCITYNQTIIRETTWSERHRKGQKKDSDVLNMLGRDHQRKITRFPFMTLVFDYILQIKISIQDQELKTMNISPPQANRRAKRPVALYFHRKTNNNMLRKIIRENKNVDSKLSYRKMSPIFINKRNLNQRTNPLPANLTLQVNSVNKPQSSKWSLNQNHNMAQESSDCKLKIYPRIKAIFNKDLSSRKMNKKTILHTFHQMARIIHLHW